MKYSIKSLIRTLYDTLHITDTMSIWHPTYKQKIKGLSNIKYWGKSLVRDLYDTLQIHKLRLFLHDTLQIYRESGTLGHDVWE